MSVSVATVEKLVVAQVNAAVTYSATPTDPRFYTTQIADAALAADAKVVAARIKNINDPRRYLYYTTQSGIAHGGTLTAFAGEIDSITFVITGGTMAGTYVATEADPRKLELEILNYTSATLIAPHYYVEGVKLYHNGATVAANSGGGSVSVVATGPTFTLTSACQAPDEDLFIVTAGTLGMLFSIEGENDGTANLYLQEFNMMLQGLESGQPITGQFSSIQQLHQMAA
jgi:hypothetical protein